jgi:hypothetical protein
MQAQRPAGIAARTGLITGLFVGVLSLPVITISGVTGGRGLLVLFLLVAFVAFAIAGYLATRRSGLVRSGVGAGTLAAAVAVFIALCLGVVIVALLAPHAALGGGRGGRLRPLPLVRTAIVRLFTGGFFMLAAGALGGLIGGLLGRLGRPRSAPGGDAPGSGARPFTPAPTPAFSPPGGGYTPGDSSPTTPQPYYPLAPAYDGDAPTIVSPSGPQP